METWNASTQRIQVSADTVTIVELSLKSVSYAHRVQEWMHTLELGEIKFITKQTCL